MLNLDVRTRCEALRIDRAGKRVEVRNLVSGTNEWLSYDKLMLSPGASPIRPPIPGIDDSRIFTLRSLEDMDRIIEATDAGMRAVAIGAGFIGLEMAEQLHHKGLSVELVELQDQVLPQLDKKMTMLLESELRHHDIGVTLGDGIECFVPTADALECHLKSGIVLKADFVVLSMGVRPDTQLARDAGLALGPRGHISVNEFQQTSDPDIYAAGDAVDPAPGTMMLLQPYLPVTAERILNQLNTQARDLASLETFGGLEAGTTVTSAPEILFMRLNEKEVLAKAEAQQQAILAQVKAKQEKAAEITVQDFAKIELKVGKVIKCEKHPDADSLLEIEAPAAGAAAVRFGSVAGKQYRIQYKLDLSADAPWADLPGTLAPTGGLGVATGLVDNAPAAFYRVRLENP